MDTAFLTHPACDRHLAGQDHAERPERLAVIEDALIAEGVFDFLQLVEAPEATRAQLERIHSTAHLDEFLGRKPSKVQRIDADTLMDAATIPAALRAAGAVIRATEMVVTGEAGNAFCCVRPPGHHATRDSAMGFCFFNNVAAGVAQALEVHGLERVAVIDFDAHASNGTEDIFHGDPRVLLCSVSQADLFTAAQTAAQTAASSEAAVGVAGGVVNVHLSREAGGAEFREGVECRWMPALDAFRPRMVFVSAGFDAHVADPMSDLRLGDDDFAWVSGKVVDLAARHAEGRLVSVLEGGYELASLARCATRHVRILLGI